MAPAVSPILLLVFIVLLSFQKCQSAISCEEEQQLDARYPVAAVIKCILLKNEDFNELPLDAKGLWLHFPKGNNVSLTSGVLHDLVNMEYLKIDITFLKQGLQPGLFENVFLPKFKTLMLLRDVNAVDGKNIAIGLMDNIFKGLNKLENLYLDNLGVQSIQPNTFFGLESLQVLDLTLNYLNGIQPNTFTHCKNLTSLKLSDNFISKFELDSFKGLTQLASLDISLNKLNKFPAGPFIHLQNLELLVAASNDLQSIQSNAFSGLTKLHYLSLARNNFTQLDPMVFKGLNSLETLILDHNKVKLKMGQFAQASNILHLYMAHNGIKDIDSDFFEGLLSVTELILSSNRISSLPSQVFYSLPTLVTLDLSENRIELVEENAFQGLTNLQTLNIQENQIETIPPGSFDDLTQIKSLYMDQNPWVCSCEVEWLIHWLQARLNQIEPNVQFYYILCSEDDPIPNETFFALIMSEHFLNDLKCGATTSSGDITDVSVSNVKDRNEKTSNPVSSSTTDNSIITTFDNKMSHTKKIVIIVFSVLAAMVIVFAILIHLYCRKRKRTWDPTQKTKSKGSDMIGHKKVSSSSADPEAGYLGIILSKYTPNIDQQDLVRPAYPRDRNGEEDDDETVYYVYQNHALSTSLEYIQHYTDINHMKRGDLSDDESQYSYNPKDCNHQKLKGNKHQTVVQMEPVALQIKNNKCKQKKRPQKHNVPTVTFNDTSHDLKNSNKSNNGSNIKSSLKTKSSKNNPQKLNINSKFSPAQISQSKNLQKPNGSPVKGGSRQLPNSLLLQKPERRDSVISEESESIEDSSQIIRDTTVDSAIGSPTEDQVSQSIHLRGQSDSKKEHNMLKQ